MPHESYRTPMALGADLAQAVASYLLADSGFLAALQQLTPIFTRARVVALVRTQKGENRVKVHRTGMQRPDSATYPVWGSMMVPQIGDDVLLARAGNQTYVLGSRGGGNPHQLLIPFPGGTLAQATSTGQPVAHHDDQGRHVHFGTLTQAGAPATTDTITFDPDSGDPIVTPGTALRDLFVAHIHGADGHSLHGGDVFFGLDLVQWDGTGPPQADGRISTKLPHPSATYGRHRVNTGTSTQLEVAMTTAGSALERLLSSHDPNPGATADSLNHRVYHDDGTSAGGASVWHEFNHEGLILPHGHRLVDSGGTTQYGSPHTAPVWHLAPGGTLAAGSWALAYTYVKSSQESAASPRWVGAIGAALAGTGSLVLPAFTVPSWATAVNFYLSTAPGALTGLRLVRTVAPSGGSIAQQTFTTAAPGGAALAPTTSTLVSPNRVGLYNGNPHLVVDGGTDPSTGAYYSRIGVDPTVGTGYFKFQDNCITFPNGQTLCDGAGGGGGATALEFLIDGGGAVITTGVQGRLVVPSASTLSKVELLADQSGSIVVDIWKSTYAGYPPSSSASITASTPPTISSAVKAQDTTLTGWTTALALGDILVFNVNSVSTIQQCTVVLTVGGGGSSGGGPITIPNFGFETPGIGSGGGAYSYEPTGASWTFTGGGGAPGAGISGNGSGFTHANNNAPEGTQVGFIQGGGSISQALTIPTSGSYTLRVLASQRVTYSPNDITVSIDGTTVASWHVTSQPGYTEYTATFSLVAGTRTLAFTGDGSAGDVTTFIDNVRLA